MTRMALLVPLLGVAQLGAVSAQAAPKPHLVFLLVDDLGYNSFFHNPDHQTPEVNQLAREEGVIIESSYTYKYCSPTRGSFLSGRLPFHLDATRCNIIPWTLLDGLNLEYTLLPQKLKTAGYSTHHVGKWHQGLSKMAYTPTHRGFDTSFGFLTGGEDHYTQRTCCDDIPTTLYPNCSGPIDLWGGSAPLIGDPRHSDEGGARGVGFAGRPDGHDANYNGYNFPAEAVRLIHAHDKATPFFLYFALHNTHSPFQAPHRFQALYEHQSSWPLEQTFNAMVSVVDESVGNVTKALKSTGMWDNSVVVWMTDNGAPVQAGGSNKPLKGGKGTNWEGGTRVPGFVSGGLLPAQMRGKTLHGMIHITDYYNTFSTLAGVDPKDTGGPTPIDSIDQWPYISGKTQTPPRQDMVYEHRKFNNDTQYTGAVRRGDWKLVVSREHAAGWFGQFSPNASYANGTGAKVYGEVGPCGPDRPCLYNLALDPTEHDNVASANPSVVKELQAWFKKLEDEYHPPLVNPPMDIEGYCASNAKHQGWLAPWRED